MAVLSRVVHAADAFNDAIEAHHVVSVEQFGPRDAVHMAGKAKSNGFDGIVLADRFQPWLPSQGNASFVWSVAAAIAQVANATTTVLAVPGYRMHPSVVAQAAATIASLGTGELRLALSAGDAIDEHVVGGYWPEAHERAARLFEAAEAIRKIFASSVKGKDARHGGAYFRLETSRLWTMPEVQPSMQIWAGGPATARRAGRTMDGIVVQAGSRERMSALLHAFQDGQREAGRSGERSRMTAHVQLSWAENDGEAMANALRDWPMAGLRFPRGDIRSPFDVDQLARSVTADDIRSRIPVSSDPDVHRAHLQSFFDLGFDSVHVHNVGRNQAEWIEIAGRDILPKLVR